MAFGGPGAQVRDMELVTLTPKLGRYFGTDKGVLVVRAPSSAEFKLEEGDVIVDIDGRAPQNGAHAMRLGFRQIMGLQRRLLDPRLSPRARRALMHRGPFREALTWLEIHGQAPEAVEHWRGFIEASGVNAGEQEGAGEFRPRRRRRRRRRSFRPATN